MFYERWLQFKNVDLSVLGPINNKNEKQESVTLLSILKDQNANSIGFH